MGANISERETERQRDRETERQRDRETEQDREKTIKTTIKDQIKNIKTNTKQIKNSERNITIIQTDIKTTISCVPREKWEGLGSSCGGAGDQSDDRTGRWRRGRESAPQRQESRGKSQGPRTRAGRSPAETPPALPPNLQRDDRPYDHTLQNYILYILVQLYTNAINNVVQKVC